jgi:hypothetical protein
VVVLAVVVVLAGLALVAVSVQPLRAHVWMAAGKDCGTVEGGSLFLPAAPDPGAGAKEACLVQAAQHCQPAILTYAQGGGIDTGLTTRLVVEPGVPLVARCDVAAVESSWVDRMSRPLGAASCAAVRIEADGLHARDCGRFGDIVVPGE